LNLVHLKFVVEISRTESFTKAADICCVTQPTLSNALQNLEMALGGKLFERTTRRVNLTPFGRHMLPAIERIVDAQEECLDTARKFFEPDLQILSVGFSPLADMRLINAIIHPFATGTTGLKTYFKECYIHALAERLEAGEVDVVFCPQLVASGVDPSKFHRQYFYSEPVYVLLHERASSANNDRGSLMISELYGEEVVLTPDGCGHAPTVRGWFAANQVQLNEYPGRALSYDVMQDWTGLGLAATILPWSKITDSNRAHARQLLFDDGQPAELHFDVLWNKRMSSVKPLASFVDFVKANGRAIISGLHVPNEKFQRNLV